MNNDLIISFRLIPSGAQCYIRLSASISGHRFNKSLTHLNLSADDWDNQRCFPFPNDNTKHIIGELENISSTLFRIYKEAKILSHPLTVKELKSQFLSQAPSLLFETLRRSNHKTLPFIGKTITYEQYQFQLGIINLMPLFIQVTYGLSDISISVLPESFPVQLKRFLEHYTTNNDTIQRQVSFICSLLVKEHRQGNIRLSEMQQHTLSYFLKFKQVPTAADIHKISLISLSNRNAIIRDAYLFSSFTGLSYEKIKQLTGLNIRTVSDNSLWLFLPGTQLPLSQLPRELQRKLAKTDNDIPLFDLPTIQYTNVVLRTIAVKCNLNIDFTFKSAHKFYLNLQIPF